MKTIGLIGGAHFESTLQYYEIINTETNKILGDHHSAKIVLVSVDFEALVTAFFAHDWHTVNTIMVTAAQQLEAAGADFIAICCNTLHKIYPNLVKMINLPIFHIISPTGEKIKHAGLNKVGLLGTKFTIQGNFHQEYLKKYFNIDTVVPNMAEQESMNQIIFDEVCHSKIIPSSKKYLEKIIRRLITEEGAQAMILGCTELPMFLPFSPDLQIPFLETTFLHAQAIVHEALKAHIKLETKDKAISIAA